MMDWISLARMLGVSFRVKAELDDCSVRGNAANTGDDAADQEIEDAIIERLARGDVWAWAYVKVSAHLEGLEGTSYLGLCSYENEAAFRGDGYFQDMCVEALENLIQQVEEASRALTKLGPLGEEMRKQAGTPR